MAKRGKAKAAAAVTDSESAQQAAQLAADPPETQPEPAAKRSRTTKKQKQQQQQPAYEDEDDQQKDAKPTAAKKTVNRRSSKQKQQKEQQEPAAGVDSVEAKVAKPKRSRTSTAAAAAAAGDKPAAEKPPYYLVKSEPEEFSIDDLEAKPNQTEPWEGVRNAQARNIMRGMSVGDLAFFYHSSCKVPGIVGIAQVVREAYPDPTAFDPNSKYYDAKSSEDNPKWWMVDWKLVRKLKRQITLEELKSHKDGSLEGMALFNRPRLSVQPVTTKEWEFIMSLEDSKE